MIKNLEVRCCRANAEADTWLSPKYGNDVFCVVDGENQVSQGLRTSL